MNCMNVLTVSTGSVVTLNVGYGMIFRHELAVFVGIG